MGLSLSKGKNNWKKLEKKSFQWIKIIGRGGFGRVHKVQHKKTKEKFAIKKMSKIK